LYEQALPPVEAHVCTNRPSLPGELALGFLTFAPEGENARSIGVVARYILQHHVPQPFTMFFQVGHGDTRYMGACKRGIGQLRFIFLAAYPVAEIVAAIGPAQFVPAFQQLLTLRLELVVQRDYFFLDGVVRGLIFKFYQC